MENEDVRSGQPAREEDGPLASPWQAKRPWQEPKLVFVEPELTTHGQLKDINAGFFGDFTPP